MSVSKKGNKKIVKEREKRECWNSKISIALEWLQIIVTG